MKLSSAEGLLLVGHRCDPKVTDKIRFSRLPTIAEFLDFAHRLNRRFEDRIRFLPQVQGSRGGGAPILSSPLQTLKPSNPEAIVPQIILALQSQLIVVP